MTTTKQTAPQQTTGPWFVAFNRATGHFYANGTFDAPNRDDAQLLNSAELAVVNATFESVASWRELDDTPRNRGIIGRCDRLAALNATLVSALERITEGAHGTTGAAEAMGAIARAALSAAKEGK